MKKLYTLVTAVLLTASIWAQTPQKFSYQAVIRDASNTLVANQKVGVAVSILQTSEIGNVVYKETHFPTTNANGLASLSIGTGSKIDGDFSKIDWSKGPYFVKTETDVTGGTSYELTAISELMSVPYALFAANSQPGPKGEKGDTGAEGPAGKDGAVGPIGPKGDTGAVGPQGPVGLPGKDGKDGVNGTNGIDGKEGAVGSQGPAGLPGKDGKDGVNGTNGIDGKDGTVGPIGPKGDTGAVGPQGAKGDKGDTGIQGPTGKDGKVEFQNLRVSTTGDTLYLTNGNYVVIPGLSAANAGVNTPPTSGYGPNITDVDGNSYKTVYIGSQQWMGENLKTGKYSDGTPIPNVTDNKEWENLWSPAWANYNNDAANDAKYGKLYNSFTISTTTNGNKNVCPTGWHVPTDEEWTVLTDYLGGATIVGGKLKEVGTSSWNSTDTEATNTSLFTGLPGGLRDSYGSYSLFGNTGYFWSSIDYNRDNTYFRNLYYTNSNVFRDFLFKKNGMSIRCLKDAVNTNNQPTQGSIQWIDCGGETNNETLTANTSVTEVNSVITYNGGNAGTYASQAIASTGVTGLTATLSAGTFANGNGSVTYNITGTPSSSGKATFAITIGGKTCSFVREIVTGENPTNNYGPNITDMDGNVYKTVVIGTQTWMAENLKTSKYSDGTPIPNVKEVTQWSQLQTGAWCNYNNNDSLGKIYGKLYNWYAISPSTNGNKNVCPTGWHVPTDSENKLMVDYLGGDSVAGGKMKEVGVKNWKSPNIGATNSSLFDGLPGGFRTIDYLTNDAKFNSIGNYGIWWCSTIMMPSSWMYIIKNNYYSVDRGGYDPKYGLSIRCLKD